VTPEIELRPLGMEHVDEILRIVRIPEVAHRWDEPDPGFPFEDEESTRFAVVVDGRVAGMIQFWEEPDPKYRHAGIDLFLDPAFHGRGIGTEAVRRVVRILIDERGHHRITIDPAADNTVAIRAYEKVGFKRVGVLRQYERDTGGDGFHDGLLMELLASDEQS
jgi:aminoglycoside 6'-N-acetyltransferase